MDFSGPNHALHAFGVTLIGVTPENGRKLALTLLVFATLWFIGRGLKLLTGAATRGVQFPRAKFWARQGINIAVALAGIVALISIWFDQPARLTSALGLVTAGVAFALQRVITAVAGYFVILRGRTFNIGDRIVMGGVRGDVIGLGFMQTTIMEMGQPPPVQSDDPAMWVKARQYTGRVVTVTNAKIFDEPVYNYTRDFPYLFEEIVVPIKSGSDWEAAERILVSAAHKHADSVSQMAEHDSAELQRRYFLQSPDFRPRVYLRITDNWIELTLRFLTHAHRVRELKDAISRDVLIELDRAGIGVASATFEIVGTPPLRLRFDAPVTDGSRQSIS
jgi:small-conductance mechanosensitive channel